MFLDSIPNYGSVPYADNGLFFLKITVSFFFNNLRQQK